MIYIDESGNLGKNGDRFFVITAVEISNPKRIKNIVKRYCASHSLEEIKGTVLGFSERQLLFNSLNKVKDYNISYLVLDKKNFYRKELLGQNVLFNYLSSFVFKDLIGTVSGDMYLNFDNRTVKTNSKYSLRDYLLAKLIEWNIDRNVQVQFHESHFNRGIQIADVVANTIYQRYTNDKTYFYDQLPIRRSIKFPKSCFGLDMDKN